LIREAWERKKLLSFYRSVLQHDLLPFWERAADPIRGGVYTCFDNRGERRLSSDKYTWSQGRFLWLWSRMADLCARKLADGDANRYMEQAARTYRFLRRHALLPNGNCAFLLTEDGEPKEPIPGQGYDTSFYADCFVILGYAEYGRVSGDREALRQAARLYESVERRLGEKSVRSEPYPVPEGLESHGYAMIMLNAAQELADTWQSADKGLAGRFRQRSAAYMADIMMRFRDAQGRVREVLTAGGAAEREESGRLLLRHLNPGHSVESMWFVMREAAHAGNGEYVRNAVLSVKRALQLGWDNEYGGLLRYVDMEGGPPSGRRTDGIEEAERFEALIETTWSMKLWWPHSEALYAALLGYRLTGDDELADWYERLHRYTFGVFPNDDKSVGEWIQIRLRDGSPSEQVVALPVKDPYHIMRNVMLIIELLSDWQR
jgi:N-acylglucosamine 2-epimerase